MKSLLKIYIKDFFLQRFLYSGNSECNYTFNNITFDNVNGYGSFYFLRNTNFAGKYNIFKNIHVDAGGDTGREITYFWLYSLQCYLKKWIFENSLFINMLFSSTGSLFYFKTSDTTTTVSQVTIRNVTFENNVGGSDEYGLITFYSRFEIYIDNCVFNNNSNFIALIQCRENSYCRLNISNTVFKDNTGGDYHGRQVVNGIVLDANASGEVYVENSVFLVSSAETQISIDNTLIYKSDSTVEFIGNNIFYGNTTTPTAKPTNLPRETTNLPTESPTKRPTKPSAFPTKSPSNETLSTDPDLTATKDIADSAANGELIREWNDTSSLVFVSSVGIGIVLFVMVYNSWKSSNKSADTMNFIAVIRFLVQVLDLWTDLSFCVILYLKKLKILFAIDIMFIMVPYSISVFVAIYFVVSWNQWQQDHPSRLKVYLNKYQFVIILSSLFGGFYATIDLFRSKIFYLSLMYLPLKKSEYNNLTYFRFVNFTLLENIPQFIIQLYYLLHHNGNDQDNQESSQLPIVFLSLGLTVISLIFIGAKIFISAMGDCFCSPRRNFAYKTTMHVNFVIDSNKFQRIHAFCHSKMQQCMLDVINTCDDRADWHGRSDVFYDIEVYHISCQHYLNKLIIYCQWTIFTMHDNHTSVIQKFRQNIIDMLADNGCQNAQQLHKVEWSLNLQFFVILCFFAL